MPTYHVDVTTERGLTRVPFTLDDDRPLGAQVRHVLEELRQQGHVMRGGPEDRLVVVWNGREVDTERSPEQLRLTPLYPIELTMRRPDPRAAARTEPPARPFLPRGPYLGLVGGFTGAVLAWLIGSMFTDLGDVLTSYGALDLAVAGVLGAGVGAWVAGLTALRRAENAVAALALGVLVGGVGSVAGALLGLFLAGLGGLGTSRQSFLVARLLVWALMAAGAGLGLALLWLRRDRRRLLDAPLLGLASGVVGGLVMSLPGPTEFWQLLAFGTIGGALGWALSRAGSALGVIELEQVSGRSPGLLAHREWEVFDDRSNAFGRRFDVAATRGRLTLVARDAGGDVPQVGGRPVTGRAELLNEDRITVGTRVFRFRRFPEAVV